jgi:hypothetical protein
MGGVVSIATRSGTNVLHGSAFEFFRNSKMDARNFFETGDPAPFTRHQFGGAGGGPIVRNRVFFYGGFERLQEDLGTTVITAVPTAAARMGLVNPAVRPYLDLYPLPYAYEFNRATRENFAQGRVDVELSDKDLLFVRHTYDGSSQLSPVSSGAIQTTGVPQFFTTSVSGNHFFTAEAKRTFTQSLLNTARFSSSVLTYEQSAANTLSQPLSFVPDQPFMGLIRALDPERRLLDVERRHCLHEGEAPAEDRRAHRARVRRQTDDGQQPGDVHVREHGAVPRRDSDPLPGQRAWSGVQAPAAEHALRLLPPGRLPDDVESDLEPGRAL